MTCGEDRNAYVWNLEGGAWKPTLVILRINRAATCVKWSPLENKFAVGSGSRLISVCYFEEENDWWVSKHIKKPLRSTVTCLDWHANNVLVAAGSSDFKCRVFSGYIKTCDEKPAATAWGKKMPFGQVMAEFGTGAGSGGWIHDVSFSASGDKLAYVSHDSSITVVDGTQEQAVVRLALQSLPFRCLSWITESSLFAAGHDYMPYIFTHTGSTLENKGSLDKPAKSTGKALSAMDKFKTLDRKGTTDTSAVGTEVASTHQNAVSALTIFKGSKAKAEVVTTTGVDGQIVFWDLAKACSNASISIV